MTLRQFLVFAPLVLTVVPVFAQDASLEGFVKGKDGKPLAGATIVMARMDVGRSYKTKTDKKGYYFYGGLPHGFFAVTLQMDGKDIAGIAGIRTQPGDPLLISFDLRVSPQEQESMVRQSLQKAGAEWGYLKIIPMAPPTQQPQAAGAAAPTPAPAPQTEAPREMSADQRAALDKATAERLAQIKARDDLNHLFTDGLTALQAKQYPQAVEALSKAAEQAPKEAGIWADLGSAYSGLASTKSGPEFDATMRQSFDAFEKALELSPKDTSTRYSYVMALAKGRKLDEMWAQARKCAELEPGSAYRTYYNVGSILTNAGMGVPAEQAFHLAMDAAPDDPKNAEAYYQYAVTLMGRAQVGADGKVIPAPGTVEALRKYLQLAPSGPNAQGARDLLGTLGSQVETKFNGSTPKKK